MNYVVREWLNLAVRWTHVFAAIMWVGQTYFFTWLDHYRRFFDEGFDRLDDYLKKLQAKGPSIKEKKHGRKK